jgi:hypothetical protein
LAGYTPLKYVVSGKPLIAPEPDVGKFQNWSEMKVNYPTNIVRQAETADFRKLLICQIFSSDVKKH